MKAKLTNNRDHVHLEASIGGVLSLNSKQVSSEKCIESLLYEVLIIAKYNPQLIDAMLEDVTNEA